MPPQLATAQSEDRKSIEKRAMKKIGARIIPLVFLLYIVAVIDRANIAYAKLTMTADLGFSEAVYGLGAGLFFVGYFVLEIPGALIVHYWGARWWIARILVTWGIFTILVGLVRNDIEFYIYRFLLGAAEAGFFPGIVVYLNQWFPRSYRARALGKFVIATPIAWAIGGPIAGAIMKLNWLDLPGWRWLFILEGIPAIILGLLVVFIMTDRPSQADWLTREEREWVIDELEAERVTKKKSYGHFSLWQALSHPRVLLLALIAFLITIGLQGFLLWLPTTVHKASGASPHLSSAISGLPFVVAIVAQLSASWSSDRTGERYLHTAVPLIAAAIIFPITTSGGLSFGWLLFWLSMTAFALYAYGPPYWTLPTLTLGDAAAAAGIGFINSIGGLGGFVGPTVIGWLLTAGYDFSRAVFFLSACFFVAGALTLVLRRYALTEAPAYANGRNAT